MSEVTDVSASLPDISASLKAALAAQRQKLSEHKAFDMDLPGYEHQGVVARYQPLDYKTMRAIGLKHGLVKNMADQELNVAGDMLTASCQDLLVRDENGNLTSLGHRLNSRAARDLFGIEAPDGIPARDALSLIIPDTMLIMAHFANWTEANSQTHAEIDEAVMGESEASSAQ